MFQVMLGKRNNITGMDGANSCDPLSTDQPEALQGQESSLRRRQRAMRASSFDVCPKSGGVATAAQIPRDQLW